jgi:hypothetical protein
MRERLKKKMDGYTVFSEKIKDESGEYFVLWLDEFGFSACSAPGDTLSEAFENLKGVYHDISLYYKEIGYQMPLRGISFKDQFLHEDWGRCPCDLIPIE